MRPKKPAAKKVAAKKTAIAVPKESTEQILFFEWVGHAFPKLIVYHVPNGGKRSLKTAVRLKREGVRAGVLDIVVEKARGIYHGMRIEMKRQKGGALSESQKEMIRDLRAEGYFVAVCQGFDEARAALLEYLAFGEAKTYG
jgi:hypothetical protein